MIPSLRPNSSCLSFSVAGSLLFLGVSRGFAEGSASYKFEDYREGDGRIAVKTQSALIEQDIGTQVHLKVLGTVDAITGATPTGQPAPAGSDQVPVAELSDRRKAWNAEFSHQFQGFQVTAGIANSRERDYVSNGWSVNTLTDFNQKNTTLLAGVAGTRDDVQVPSLGGWAKKRTNDVILGVTQLIDASTTVAVDFTWGRGTGYLSDPYKVVQKRVEVNPGDFLNLLFDENRPGERNKWIVAASLNHAFQDLHGALDGSYRFYHDTFGTTAHTLALSWLQRFGKDIVLSPEFRYYDQSAANFYYYQLDQTSIVPPFGTPSPQGPFYSSDYRLSALRTFTYGLRAVWTPSARIQFDLAFDEYDMRGKDGVTAQSAYPRAKIVTAGLKISW